MLASRSLLRYPPLQEIAATATPDGHARRHLRAAGGAVGGGELRALATLLLVALFGDVSDGTALRLHARMAGMTWLVRRHWRSGSQG